MPLLDKGSGSLDDHLQLQLPELFWSISSLHVFAATQLPIPALSHALLQHVQGSPGPVWTGLGPTPYHWDEEDEQEQQYKVYMMPAYFRSESWHNVNRQVLVLQCKSFMNAGHYSTCTTW